MGLPGRPHVEAKVVPIRRIEPLVSKELLDVPARAAIDRSVVATVCRKRIPT